MAAVRDSQEVGQRSAEGSCRERDDNQMDVQMQQAGICIPELSIEYPLTAWIADYGLQITTPVEAKSH